MNTARLALQIRTEWKKVAVVGLGGMLFGFACAASNRALTHRVAHQVIYLQSSQAQSDDVEQTAKLKARNRRLKVLFDVLRQRQRGRNPQQISGSGE